MAATYKFYFKNDPNKEAIFLCKANSREEAIETFTLMKKLDTQSFLDLYQVE